MDVSLFLSLFAFPNEAFLSSLADFGVLAAAVALFFISALALVRQILFAVGQADR